MQIKRNDKKCTEAEKKEFGLFLQDLYHELLRYKTENQAVNKIKDLWHLFSQGFENTDAVLNRIIHASNITEMIEISNDIVVTEKRK